MVIPYAGRGAMACSNGYAGDGRGHGPLLKLLTASWQDPAIGANRRLTLTRLKSLSAPGRISCGKRRVRTRGRPGSSGNFFRGAAAACETHAKGLAMRLTYIPMSASLARSFFS